MTKKEDRPKETEIKDLGEIKEGELPANELESISGGVAAACKTVGVGCKSLVIDSAKRHKTLTVSS